MSTTMVSVTVIDSDGASDIAAPAGTTVAGLCAMLAIDLTEPSVRLSYADGRPRGGAVLGRDLAAGSVIALSSRVLSAQQVNEASARQENQWLSPVLALVGFSFLLLAAASALCLLPTLGDAALRELTYAEDGPAWARAASSIPVWARGLCALVCMIGATTPLFCSRRVRSHPIMLLLLPALVGYSMIGLVPLAGIHALSVAPVVGVWSALIVTLAVASLTGAPSALSAIIAWGAATLLVTIHAYPLFALIDIAPLAVMIGVLLFLMSPRLALRVPDNQLIDSTSLQTIASRIRQPPASAPSTLTGERIATVLSYTSARNTVLLVAASLFVLVGGILAALGHVHHHGERVGIAQLFHHALHPVFHVVQILIRHAELLHQIVHRLDVQLTGAVQAVALLLHLTIVHPLDEDDRRTFLASNTDHSSSLSPLLQKGVEHIKRFIVKTAVHHSVVEHI